MGRLIAITTKDANGLDSRLDDRFGRAPVILVVDADERKVVDTLTNEASNSPHGAGIGTASFVAGLEVEAIVSGRYGPNATSALDSLGLTRLSFSGQTTAGEVLDAFAAGSLTSGVSHDKPHRGMGGGGGGGRGMGGGGGRGMGGGGGRGRG